VNVAIAVPEVIDDRADGLPFHDVATLTATADASRPPGLAHAP
jgi:hypothetical protein